MATKTRNRVIYQSEALYVGQPSATGVHINAVISEDDAPQDTSGRIFGLIKDPSDLEDICILDWKDYWTPISAPIDLVNAGGSPVAPYLGAYSKTVDYKKDDVVDIQFADGSKIYFEARSDIEQNGDTYKLDYGVAGKWSARDYYAGETVYDAGSDSFFETLTSIDFVSTDDFNVFFRTNPGGYKAGGVTKADSGNYYQFTSDFIGVVADVNTVVKATAGDEYVFVEGGNYFKAVAAGEGDLNDISIWNDTGVTAFEDAASSGLAADVTGDFDDPTTSTLFWQPESESYLYSEVALKKYVSTAEYGTLSVAIQAGYISDSTVALPPAVSLQSFTDSGKYSFTSKSFSDWSIEPAVRQLNRVQNANYSFSFNRQDVNQFGQLHRIDSVAIDPPTVSLDFSYYVNNGANEKLIGFHVNDYDSMLNNTAQNFINMKEQEDDFEGKNFFILTTPQGEDAVMNNAWDANGNVIDDSSHSTIALGNGYVTNYSLEASVGGMPTASVTVEGLNLKSDSGFHNVSLPAVDNSRGTPIQATCFTLPPPVSGVLDDSAGDPTAGDGDLFSAQAEGFSCLRPGDIEMHLGTEGRAGMMNKLPSGTPPTDHEPSGCHVQSFSIELPMSRTPLQRLGTPYAYTRPVDLPLTVNINVSAIVSDLKSGNIADHLFEFENHDLHFILREPQVDGRGPIALAFFAKGAQLESESFSSSIGDNKSVDLTFTCQVGGAEDTSRGLMIAGSRGALPKADGTHPLLHRFDPAEK
tara:strand:- start:732 stop:2990 length:2259 start_codon:yes stop_codon:yes gene_type:complete